MINLHHQSEFPYHFPIPLRTLVVDDSVVLLENLCRYLQSKPLFQVFGAAANGSEALRLAELHEPDLILMDRDMPVMDGLKATVVLRRRLPGVRIIIMTQDDSAEAEAEARAQGAHGFIWKPAIKNDQRLMAEVRGAFHPAPANDQRSSP